MRNKSEKRKIHKRFRYMPLLLILIGMCFAGGMVYAKLYINKSSKGVTVAADYYFSSNLLKDTDGNLKNIYNTNAWDGNSPYTFEIMIQNYRNHLLYNAENLDITYKLNFLLEESDGGTYRVKYIEQQEGGSQEIEKTLNVGEAFEMADLKLKGGSTDSNMVSLVITPPDNKSLDYISKGVKVTAEITAPDYLQGKQQLGGILYAGIVSAEYALDTSFSFEEGLGTSDWQTVVQSMAAFPYSITYQPDAGDSSPHEIQISWNSNLIELDYYEDYILRSNISTDDRGISTTTIQMLPYETVDLLFFRTEKFNLENIENAEEFQNLITVQDLNLTQ